MAKSPYPIPPAKGERPLGTIYYTDNDGNEAPSEVQARKPASDGRVSPYLVFFSIALCVISLAAYLTLHSQEKLAADTELANAGKLGLRCGENFYPGVWITRQNGSGPTMWVNKIRDSDSFVPSVPCKYVYR